MEKFITASPASKNALNMMMVSSSLPVNILVFGEEGVGRKRLISMAFTDSPTFFATELERLLRENKVDFSEESEVVIYDIDKAGNAGQLVERLETLGLKVIATASQEKAIFQEKFLVKIDIPPLSQRAEDTAILVKDYIKKAKDLFRIETTLDVEVVDVNLEQNSISLKESIYRSLLLNSIDKKQMMDALEQFLSKVIEEESDYKVLLEIFEVPLLKAMRTKYKSQLQMASKLGINRNTLRKKMYQYGLEEK
jgi:DNA-binding NtrC family response regulator